MREGRPLPCRGAEAAARGRGPFGLSARRCPLLMYPVPTPGLESSVLGTARPRPEFFGRIRMRGGLGPRKPTRARMARGTRFRAAVVGGSLSSSFKHAPDATSGAPLRLPGRPRAPSPVPPPAYPARPGRHPRCHPPPTRHAPGAIPGATPRLPGTLRGATRGRRYFPTPNTTTARPIPRRRFEHFPMPVQQAPGGYFQLPGRSLPILGVRRVPVLTSSLTQISGCVLGVD
jgi:hypothetical protein